MKDYIVAAPGYQIVILPADSLMQARFRARQALAVGKLPKGTVIELYTAYTYINNF